VKTKRYTQKQIIAVLREVEAGTKVADLCPKYGKSDASYYNWKARMIRILITALMEDFARNSKHAMPIRSTTNQVLCPIIPGDSH
jgi:hypothetical protein